MTAEPDGPSSSFLAPEYSNLMCELSTVYPPVRVFLGGSHSMPRIHGDEIGLLNYLGMIRPISDHTSKHGRLSSGAKAAQGESMSFQSSKNYVQKEHKIPRYPLLSEILLYHVHILGLATSIRSE